MGFPKEEVDKYNENWDGTVPSNIFNCIVTIRIAIEDMQRARHYLNIKYTGRPGLYDNNKNEELKKAHHFMNMDSQKVIQCELLSNGTLRILEM